MQKYNVQKKKKNSNSNQNASTHLNSITNLKFQHKQINKKFFNCLDVYIAFNSLSNLVINPSQKLN